MHLSRRTDRGTDLSSPKVRRLGNLQLLGHLVQILLSEKRKLLEENQESILDSSRLAVTIHLPHLVHLDAFGLSGLRPAPYGRTGRN
jgi:hypothetical protein